jgi:5-methylcytosine-specific restriction endonuclease McrA
MRKGKIRYSLLCVDCWKQKDYPSLKPTYRKTSYKNLKATLVINGLCKVAWSCTNPILDNSPYCLEHWLRLAYVKKTARFDVTYEEIGWLWNKQEGKCAISGEQLVPGINVHCDHIIPLDKSGSKTIDNLRFITKDLNFLKQGMTESDFKASLSKIVNNATLISWLSK